MTFKITDILRLQPIEKIIIHSHESNLYLVSILHQGEEHYIVDKKNDLLKSHTPMALQALFKDMNYDAMVLKQTSPYDEMIGHPKRDQENTMEVPVGNIEFAQS